MLPEMDWTQMAVTKPSHLRAEGDGGERRKLFIEIGKGREKVEKAVCCLGNRGKQSV